MHVNLLKPSTCLTEKKKKSTSLRPSFPRYLTNKIIFLSEFLGKIAVLYPGTSSPLGHITMAFGPRTLFYQ